IVAGDLERLEGLGVVLVVGVPGEWRLLAIRRYILGEAPARASTAAKSTHGRGAELASHVGLVRDDVDLLPALLCFGLDEIVMRRHRDDRDARLSGEALQRVQRGRTAVVEVDAEQLDPVDAQRRAALDHLREGWLGCALWAFAKSVEG